MAEAWVNRAITMNEQTPRRSRAQRSRHAVPKLADDQQAADDFRHHGTVTDTTVIAAIFAKTDLGRTRDHNEDAFLIADLTAGRSSLHSSVAKYTVGPRGLLILVADGMGGAAAGELASAMAADLIFGHLIGTWTKEEEISPDRFTLRLREAVELANLQIHTYAREHPEVRGHGDHRNRGRHPGRPYLPGPGG